MSKQVYKIPAGLNRDFLDLEIAIQGKDGVGVRPLPVKTILTYVFGIILGFFLVTKTFIGRGSGAQIAGFVILWAWLVFTMASFDTTKRMKMQWIPALFEYMTPANRLIYTRTATGNANTFVGLIGIQSIDEETGMIYFTDGTYGLSYRVVGSASVLLFDADRDAIIERVDSFYRKWQTDTQCIFITTKEAQNVDSQVANLVRKYNNLKVQSDDLKDICESQATVLKDHVGHEFRSIHQYLIIKANNKEALQRSKNILKSEYENSTLMIKDCRPLYVDELEALLGLIYKAK